MVSFLQTEPGMGKTLLRLIEPLISITSLLLGEREELDSYWECRGSFGRGGYDRSKATERICEENCNRRPPFCSWLTPNGFQNQGQQASKVRWIMKILRDPKYHEPWVLWDYRIWGFCG